MVDLLGRTAPFFEGFLNFRSEQEGHPEIDHDDYVGVIDFVQGEENDFTEAIMHPGVQYFYVQNGLQCEGVDFDGWVEIMQHDILRMSVRYVPDGSRHRRVITALNEHLNAAGQRHHPGTYPFWSSRLHCLYAMSYIVCLHPDQIPGTYAGVMAALGIHGPNSAIAHLIHNQR
jgi:hypothetical protein